MEIVDRSEGASHGHAWLKWLGLQAPPPGPDSWVPVARGFHLDEVEGDSSTDASRLIDRLHRANIKAHQRAYQFNEIDPTHFHALGAVASGQMVTRVAVMVTNRDRGPALEIAEQFHREQHGASPPQPAVSHEELTREAVDAGPPPDDLTA